MDLERVEVHFSYDEEGTLGVHLTSWFDEEHGDLVILVEELDAGSPVEAGGVKVGDWLEEVNGFDIRVWNDSDHDGQCSEPELAALLERVRAMDPTERDEVPPTAHELMEQFDHDRSHFLEPDELVELMNDEVLDSIQHLVSKRPLQCTFSRAPPPQRTAKSSPQRQPQPPPPQHQPVSASSPKRLPKPPPPQSKPQGQPLQQLQGQPLRKPRKRRLSMNTNMSVEAFAAIDTKRDAQMKKALRKRVVVSIPTHAKLGIEIVSAYVATQNRIVVDVTRVTEGGQMHSAGVHAEDWILEIADITIDLMNDADTDGDGRISLSELDALLLQIHKLAHDDPDAHHREQAHELMEKYDTDHDHSLDPSELVNMINGVLLQAIVKIIRDAPRPTEFVISRRDEEAIAAANRAADEASYTAEDAVEAASIAAQRAQRASADAMAAGKATHRGKRLLPKKARARRSSMTGAAHHAEDISGWMLKKSSGAFTKWQKRYFTMQTHYLCYKVNEGDAQAAGGVDIQGKSATIELLNNGTILKVVGLDAEVHDPTQGRELRTFMLKANGRNAAPTLQAWCDALTKSQAALRLNGPMTLQTIAEENTIAANEEKKRRMSASGMHPDFIPSDHMDLLRQKKGQMQASGSLAHGSAPRRSDGPIPPFALSSGNGPVFMMQESSSLPSPLQGAVAAAGSDERGAAQASGGTGYQFPAPRPPPQAQPQALRQFVAPKDVSAYAYMMRKMENVCNRLVAKSLTAKEACWAAIDAIEDGLVKDRIDFDTFRFRFNDHCRKMLPGTAEMSALKDAQLLFFHSAATGTASTNPSLSLAELECAMPLLFRLEPTIAADLMFSACNRTPLVGGAALQSGGLNCEKFTTAACVVFAVSMRLNGRSGVGCDAGYQRITEADALAMFDEMVIGSWVPDGGSSTMSRTEFRSWFAMSATKLGIRSTGATAVSPRLNAHFVEAKSLPELARASFGAAWGALSPSMQRAVASSPQMLTTSMQRTVDLNAASGGGLPVGQNSPAFAEPASAIDRIDAIALVRTFYGGSWKYVSEAKKRELIAAAQSNSTLFSGTALPMKRDLAAAHNKAVSAGMRRGLVRPGPFAPSSSSPPSYLTKKSWSSPERRSVSPPRVSSRPFSSAPPPLVASLIKSELAAIERELQRARTLNRIPAPPSSPHRQQQQQQQQQRYAYGVKLAGAGAPAVLYSPPPTPQAWSPPQQQEQRWRQQYHQHQHQPLTPQPQVMSPVAVHVNRRGSVDITRQF